MDLHERIEVVQLAEAQARALTAEAARLRALLQFHCPHERVIEIDYAPSNYGDALPPHKVCLACGFAEYGWSCGYQVLTAKPERVDVPREEAQRYRIGKVHDNAQFVGYYLDVNAAGGREAYRRKVLCAVLGLTETDVHA